MTNILFYKKNYLKLINQKRMYFNKLEKIYNIKRVAAKKIIFVVFSLFTLGTISVIGMIIYFTFLKENQISVPLSASKQCSLPPHSLI